MDSQGTGALAQLLANLEAEGYCVEEAQSEPFHRSQAHSHPYAERLIMLMGSLTVALISSGKILELMAGDSVEIPAGMVHGVLAGTEGAYYLVCSKGTP